MNSITSVPRPGQHHPGSTVRQVLSPIVSPGRFVEDNETGAHYQWQLEHHIGTKIEIISKFQTQKTQKTGLKYNTFSFGSF